MADSVILDIKSWLSTTGGRKHLLDIVPQFTTDTSYSYESTIIGVDDTLSVTCGKIFTYVYADKPITYQIEDGTEMQGQLIMLTNILAEDAEDPSITISITGITATTTVMIILVN